MFKQSVSAWPVVLRPGSSLSELVVLDTPQREYVFKSAASETLCKLTFNGDTLQNMATRLSLDAATLRSENGSDAAGPLFFTAQSQAAELARVGFYLRSATLVHFAMNGLTQNTLTAASTVRITFFLAADGLLTISLTGMSTPAGPFRVQVAPEVAVFGGPLGPGIYRPVLIGTQQTTEEDVWF